MHQSPADNVYLCEDHVEHRELRKMYQFAHLLFSRGRNASCEVPESSVAPHMLVLRYSSRVVPKALWGNCWLKVRSAIDQAALDNAQNEELTFRLRYKT